MKRLIINGDDYGYTPEKNEGILRAHEEGILTSTTVMVNMVSEEAVKKLLRRKKSLGIGLHLNVTIGKPVSLPEEVPSLVNEKKELFKPQERMRKEWNDFGNLKNVAEVELEFNNQLKKFKEKFDIKPSHLDSHHSITGHKKIFPVYIKIAKENNLPVRLPAWVVPKRGFELEMPLARETKKQCRTTDYAVFDLFWDKKNPLEQLKKALGSLKKGTTEFMFHPSLFKFGDEKSAYGKIDIDLLTNPGIKKTIKEEDIQLINYNQL